MNQSLRSSKARALSRPSGSGKDRIIFDHRCRRRLAKHRHNQEESVTSWPLKDNEVPDVRATRAVSAIRSSPKALRPAGTVVAAPTATRAVPRGDGAHGHRLGRPIWRRVGSWPSVNVEVRRHQGVADGSSALRGPQRPDPLLIGYLAEGANFRVIEFHVGPSAQSYLGSRALQPVVEPAHSVSSRPMRDLRYLREEACATGPFNAVSPIRTRLREGGGDRREPGWNRRWPGRIRSQCRPVVRSRSEGRQVVIGSCTNGRLDDLRGGGGIVRQDAARARSMLVFSGSWRYGRIDAKGVSERSGRRRSGDHEPGCGVVWGCTKGLGRKVAWPRRTANFKGRMGNPKSSVYLASRSRRGERVAGVITARGKGPEMAKCLRLGDDVSTDAIYSRQVHGTCSHRDPQYCFAMY